MKTLFLDYVNGYWKQQHNKDRYVYCVPIPLLGTVYSILAIVAKKNDNRWEWFRKQEKNWDKVERDHPIQGVCMTLEEAKEKAVEDIQKQFVNYQWESAKEKAGV